MSNTYQSKDELVKWFAQEPRTLNWDAFMALDQAKTNLLLQQEYIVRFGGSSYIDPITDTDRVSGITEQLVGYRLDKPRISFEDANTSSAKIRMTLRSVSGTYLKWSGDASVAQLSEITQIDPLSGHTFTSTIALKDFELDEGIGVALDLADGTDAKLTSTRYERDQSLSGDFIQGKLKAMGHEKTRFTLSYLTSKDDDLIRPMKIKILTQPAPDAAHGDGAVLVFVNMVGNSEEGHLPNAGWKYMLNPDTHSALLVLSNTFLMEKVVGHAFYDIKTNGDQQVTGDMVALLENEGAFKRVGVKDGNSGTFWGRGAMAGTFTIPYGVKEHSIDLVHGFLHMSCKENCLAGRWRGGFSRLYDDGDKVGYSFSMVWKYDPVISNNEITFEFNPVFGDEGWEDQDSSLIQGHFMGNIDRFANAMGSVNTASLSNLLFSAAVPLHLKDVKVPGDMLIFGDINPELTTFTLTETEISLVAGATYTFKWSGAAKPTFEKPEWADGSGSDCGKFTDVTYTAPTTLPAGRNFVRVRVKATAGTASSYALITVGSRPISVNPLVQMSISKPAEKPLLTAGAFNGGAVTFSSKSGGTFVSIGNGQAAYTAPDEFYDEENEDNVLIDTITAKSGGHTAECTVVTHKNDLFKIYLVREKSDFDKRKVVLRVASGLLSSTREANANTKAAADPWSMLAGTGSLKEDENDMNIVTFSAGEPSANGFYLIELKEPVRGGFSYGYVLLPADLTLLKTPLS